MIQAIRRWWLNQKIARNLRKMRLPLMAAEWRMIDRNIEDLCTRPIEI